MLCPTHHQELSINTVDNIQVNECKSCKGIWFGKGELEKALDTVNINNKDKYQILSNKEINNKKNEQFSRGMIYCPSCQIGMFKKTYRLNSDVIVDRCNTCQGCWLDEGELQQLIMEFKGATVLEFKDAKKAIEEELKRYCSKGINHQVNRFANYCETCGSPVIDKKHAKKNSIAGVSVEKEMEVFAVKSEPSITFDLKKLGLYKEHPSVINISIQENNGLIWVGFGIGVYCVWDILIFDKGPIKIRSMQGMPGEFPIRAKMVGNWIVIWSNKRIFIEDVRAIISTPRTEKVHLAFEKIAGEKVQFSPDPLAVEFKRADDKAFCLKVCWLEIDDKGDCFASSITVDAFDKTSNVLKSEKLFDCKEFDNNWPYLLPGTEDLLNFIAVGAQGVFVLSFNNETLEFIKIPDVLEDSESFKLRSYDQDCGGVILSSNINGPQFFCAIEAYKSSTRKTFTAVFSVSLKGRNAESLRKYNDEKLLCVHTLRDIKTFCSTNFNEFIFRDPVNGRITKKNYSNLFSSFFLIKSIETKLSVFVSIDNQINRYNLNDNDENIENIEHEKYLDLTYPVCLAKIRASTNELLLNGLLLPRYFLK